MESEFNSTSQDEVTRGNHLISSYANLIFSERVRYLRQASQLIESGSLEVSRDGARFNYEISDNLISFHVDRLAKKTSVSGRLPMPNSEEEIIEKLVAVFAQSEAVSEI